MYNSIILGTKDDAKNLEEQYLNDCFTPEFLKDVDPSDIDDDKENSPPHNKRAIDKSKS